MSGAPLDPAIIAELLIYDPSDGSLVWRARNESYFAAPSQHSPAYKCRQWNGRFAGKVAGYAGGIGGRHTIKILARDYLAHRVAWAIAYGEWPDVIDHIDGDPSNNRLANLRSVTLAENNRNLGVRSNNASGVMGVSFVRSRWEARIGFDRKDVILGRFESMPEAVAARSAALKAHGFHDGHGMRPSRKYRSASPPTGGSA